MKTLKILTLLIAFSYNVNAQTDSKYGAAMQRGLTMLDTATQSVSYLTTANYFERIAKAEPKQWLAQYYTAFSNLHAVLLGKQNSETKDALYDKALEYIQKANTLMPENSEVYALKGYIVFMKMSVAPQVRAMNMIPQANALIEKAISLNIENPRAYLIKGQNTFYTPEAFGGGKLKAKPILLMANEKFEKFKSEKLEPNWGKTRCNSLLQMIN